MSVVTEEIFTVEDFPKKRTGGGGGGRPGLRSVVVRQAIEEAQENPGVVFCVRQYPQDKGSQASAYRTSILKHYPEADVRSRVMDDGRTGVFVRF